MKVAKINLKEHKKQFDIFFVIVLPTAFCEMQELMPISAYETCAVFGGLLVLL